MYYSQCDVDEAFRDYERSSRVDAAVCGGRYACTHCGSTDLRYNSRGSSDAGTRVCLDCGVVQPGMVLFETMYGRDIPTRCSNYKRIHHWHERISQLLLHESPIPADQMLRIGECLLSGDYKVLDKDVIRGVLRSLGMQVYIEKWLQIIDLCTGVRPPIIGSSVLSRIDEMFTQMQSPFKNRKPEGRRNFLNYNYVFCRIFQILDCDKFCMFFPLIKSKQKLASLDRMWETIARDLQWSAEPLKLVAPFAVQVEQPALLLSNLQSRVERRRTAGLIEAQRKRECPYLDPTRALTTVQRQRSPGRSVPPASRPRRLAVLLKLRRKRAGADNR